MFIISLNGINSNLYSVSVINFEKSNPDRVVITGDSPFAGLINSTGDDVTMNDIKKVKDVKITSGSGISSLKELYNFTSLTKLELIGVSLSSLSGIENAAKIDTILFEDCTIGDYSAICKIDKNIYKMYLCLNPGFETAQSEVDKFLNKDTGIQMGNFSKLEYFGIFGNRESIELEMGYWTRFDKNNVTDISEMTKLTTVTKEKIQYLYLNDLNINNIECLNGYNNLTYLNVVATSIKTFKGIENIRSMTKIWAKSCGSLGTLEVYDATDEANNYGKSSINDALSYIPTNTNGALSVSISSDKIKFVSYINSWRAGSTLSCDSQVLGEKDLEQCLGKLKSGHLSVSSKYSSYLNSESRMDLKDLGLTNTQLFNKLDGGFSVLEKLRIDGNTLLTDDVEEGEISLSSILNQCTKMKNLSMVGITGIDNVNFVQYMPKLVELNIKDCSNIVDISILETLTIENKLTLRVLSMNTYNTKDDNGVTIPDWSKSNDITTIQSVISKFVHGGYADNTWGSSYVGDITDSKGLVMPESMYKRLEDCEDITNLFCYRRTAIGDLDLSRCTNLSTIELYNSLELGDATWTLPRSVTSIDFGGTKKSPKISLPDYDPVLGYSLLTSLKVAGDSDDQTLLNNYFEEISKTPNFETLTLNLRNYPDDLIDFSKLNFSSFTNSKLTSIELTRYNFIIPATRIIGINAGMSSLTKLGIYDYANLKEINGLENLVNLTELKVQKCKLISIKNIANLSELEILNLYENSISEIYYIKDLSKLEELNLENNALYNDGSVKVLNEENEEVTVMYKTLDILYDLNYNTGKGNSLRGLWISGNTGITDFSKLSDTSWPNGKNGF